MMEDRDVLKALERVLDVLQVRSMADGNYLVEVTYKDDNTPGSIDRQHIAAEIAELLYRRIGKLRSSKLFGKRRPSTVDDHA